MENFQIGIITKPHGLKGEVRAVSTSDSPERFELLVDDEVILQNKVQTKYKITSARIQKNMVYLKFEGITDRTAAESLIGSVILIEFDKRLPLSSDEYYVRDLIGLDVFSEENEKIGTLTNILNTPAQDLYEITPADEKSFLVPAVKEFIKEVDTINKKIVVNLINGLR